MSGKNLLEEARMRFLEALGVGPKSPADQSGMCVVRALEDFTGVSAPQAAYNMRYRNQRMVANQAFNEILARFKQDPS